MIYLHIHDVLEFVAHYFVCRRTYIHFVYDNMFDNLKHFESTLISLSLRDFNFHYLIN